VQLEVSKVDKKAQGRTFWIVITAVIALVVLVVVLMIFTGKIWMLDTELMNCESKGGECIPLTAENCAKSCEAIGKSHSSLFTCPSEGECCCLGVKESGE
jgi:hypothetical protein